MSPPKGFLAERGGIILLVVGVRGLGEGLWIVV
jgi:hypothetical protein